MKLTKAIPVPRNIGCLIMILILVFVSFAPVSISAEETTPDSAVPFLVPELVPQKNWKLSNADGPIDWSPVENILVVVDRNSIERGKITVYDANGTALFTVAEFGSGESLSPARFSPDGSKIAYFHRLYEESVSELQVFDMKSRSERTISLENTVSYFDWGANENEIIYATEQREQPPNTWPYTYQIRKHDLITGAESVISNSIHGLLGFDVSPNGRHIAFIRAILVEEPCTTGPYGNCSIRQLVIMPLTSSSESVGEASNDTSNSTSSFQVVAQVTAPNNMSSPRWTPDSSKVTYSTGFRCADIIAVSKDGTTSQSLISWGQGNALDGCYNFGASFNKDSSMVAYSINYPGITFSEHFHPVNSGLHLSFTELCEDCPDPSRTIPILQGASVSGMTVKDEATNLRYSVFGKIGYREHVGSVLDGQEKKLTMELKTPMSGKADERDVTLYLPSKLIDGEMSIFLNGIQIYPKLAEGADDQCSLHWSEEYCARITANIDKIDGWSIVQIKDETTDPRDGVTIEIIGTSAIPEFGSIIGLSMAAGIVGSIIAVRQLQGKRKG